MAARALTKKKRIPLEEWRRCPAALSHIGQAKHAAHNVVCSHICRLAHSCTPRPCRNTMVSAKATGLYSRGPKSIPGLNPTAAFVTHTPLDTNPAALNR